MVAGCGAMFKGGVCSSGAKLWAGNVEVLVKVIRFRRGCGVGAWDGWDWGWGWWARAESGKGWPP